MNVVVMTITGEDFMFPDCDVTYDKTVLQMIEYGQTTTFPLTSVLWFSFDDSVPS